VDDLEVVVEAVAVRVRDELVALVDERLVQIVLEAVAVAVHARPLPSGTLRSERTMSDLSTFLLASEV
jgi:hypothetical protein